MADPKPPFPPQDTGAPPGLETGMRPRPRYHAPSYRGSGKLGGKVALVTGGDSGIGRAVAVLFAREGADVAITHLPEEAEDARESVAAVEREGRRALACTLDVRDAHACEAVVAEVVARLGRLDVLVNNAAYQNHVERPEALTLEQWDRTFRTNIYGYFYMARAALPHLDQGSVILNTGSVTAFDGTGTLLDYSATKGAIHTFTKALAQALLPRGIRVNCVAPGPVWTPLNPAERSEEETAQFGAHVPMGRPAQPDEIAPAFVFLASSDASYVTGEVLPLTGGKTHG